MFLFLFLACCVWNWVDLVDLGLFFVFHNFGEDRTFGLGHSADLSALLLLAQSGTAPVLTVGL